MFEAGQRVELEHRGKWVPCRVLAGVGDSPYRGVLMVLLRLDNYGRLIFYKSGALTEVPA